jgi:large subunit ribosomal protein L21
MYAVIALGGKQYRVTPGERLVVDRLPHAEGESFAPPVLLASDGTKTILDAPALAKVSVQAVVREHTKGPKIRILRYRPKSNYMKRRGHRSHVSVIEIEKIAV